MSFPHKPFVMLVVLNSAMGSIAASEDASDFAGGSVVHPYFGAQDSRLGPSVPLANALLEEANAVCRQDPATMVCPSDASVDIAVVGPWTDLTCRTKWGVRSGRSCRTMDDGFVVWCADYVRGRQTGLLVDCVGVSVTTMVNSQPTGIEVRRERFPHGEGSSLSYSEWRGGVQDGVEYQRSTLRAEGGSVEVVRISHYRRGRENGVAEEWIDGRLISIRTFQKGRQTGLQVDFKPDGTIRALEFWNNSRTLYRSPSTEGPLAP